MREKPAQPPKTSITSAKTPPASRTDQSLLSVKDIAFLDGVSEKTVRRAIAAGQLTALRIGPGGRLLRVTRQAHAAYRVAGHSW